MYSKARRPRASRNRLMYLRPLRQEEFWESYNSNGTLLASDSPPLERDWLLSPKDTDMDWQGISLLHGETRTSNTTADSKQRIPKIIHKVYIEKSGGFPSTMNRSQKAALQSWHKQNPSYQVQYFDLARCRAYLAVHFHPVFLRAFDCIEAFAAKADMFRQAVVYREGGWYSDWKQIVIMEGLLDRLLASTRRQKNNKTEIFLFLDRGADAGGAEWLDAQQCLQNSFFGAIPRHPVIGETLQLILQNVQKQDYGQSALHIAGPCAFGQAYRQSVAKNLIIPDVNVEFGIYNDGALFLDSGGRRLILHKCNMCGSGQDWKDGNNYNVLYEEKHFFCEDARSLFMPITSSNCGDTFLREINEGC